MAEEASAAAAASSGPAPTPPELEAAIREALEGAALEDITQRSLRATLEERFGQDLTEQKASIKEITIRVLSEREEEEEEAAEEGEGDGDEEDGSSSGSGSDGDSSDEEEAGGGGGKKGKAKGAKKKGGGGFNKEYAWSEEMTAFLGGDGYASRAQVTKALWAHIKQHNLQNPSDKRQILCDPTLERLFGVKTVGMFKMAQYLNKHLREDDRVKEEAPSEGDEDEDDDSEAEAKPKKSKAGKAKKASGGGGGGGGFNKEHAWSAEMVAFLGVGHMSRPQVTKALWAHIKQHDLQDPSDKRQILCDATLEKLFGVKSLGMFQMAKYVNKHLLGEDGLPVKAEVDSDEEGGSGGKRKAAKAAAKPKAKKPKKAASSGDSKRGFPPERLSAELAAVVGKAEASRNEVVKALWAHIKGHGLQDPSDGRQILCDATLKGIFGVDRVSGFGMNKFLAPHFLGRA